MLVSVRLVGDGLAGARAASVTYVTYPLDVVRTRLATQEGEAVSKLLSILRL